MKASEDQEHAVSDQIEEWPGIWPRRSNRSPGKSETAAKDVEALAEQVLAREWHESTESYIPF